MNNAQVVHDRERPRHALGQRKRRRLGQRPGSPQPCKGAAIHADGHGVEPAKVLVRLVDLENGWVWWIEASVRPIHKAHRALRVVTRPRGNQTKSRLLAVGLRAPKFPASALPASRDELPASDCGPLREGEALRSTGLKCVLGDGSRLRNHLRPGDSKPVDDLPERPRIRIFEQNRV